jgi:hypothetical protein
MPGVAPTGHTGDIERPLANRPPNEPSKARLAASHPHREAILAAHDEALAAGHPGYLDPATGLYVQTAATLAAIGRCCDSGCRHCPWEP